MPDDKGFGTLNMQGTRTWLIREVETLTSQCFTPCFVVHLKSVLVFQMLRSLNIQGSFRVPLVNTILEDDEYITIPCFFLLGDVEASHSLQP